MSLPSALLVTCALGFSRSKPWHKGQSASSLFGRWFSEAGVEWGVRRRREANEQCFIKAPWGAARIRSCWGIQELVLHMQQSFPSQDGLPAEAGVFVHQLLSVLGWRLVLGAVDVNIPVLASFYGLRESPWQRDAGKGSWMEFTRGWVIGQRHRGLVRATFTTGEFIKFIKGHDKQKGTVLRKFLLTTDYFQWEVKTLSEILGQL